MRLVLPWLVLAVVVLTAGISLLWRPLSEEEAGGRITSARMEVVNGCGVPRVGRAVAEQLQARGFDVYAVRTDTGHWARTTVVDLRDVNGASALAVAEALSTQRRWRRLPLGRRVMPEVKVGLDSSRYLEVSLVVGADYRRFFPRVIPLY